MLEKVHSSIPLCSRLKRKKKEKKKERDECILYGELLDPI